jgi:hypothetical protein
MKKPLPYHTGKVQIGLNYVPPKRNYMTHEEEFWQSVILGERQIERYLLNICYLMGAVAGLIMLILWVALK